MQIFVLKITNRFDIDVKIQIDFIVQYEFSNIFNSIKIIRQFFETFQYKKSIKCFYYESELRI